MGLSSAQLDAFLEISKTGSFSRAAQNLAVTQSALSQRLSNLELELEVTLLIRGPDGVRLTWAGEELLQYCRIRHELEGEFMGRIRKSRSHALGGIIRVGAFSTVARSVVLPSLSPLLRQNPDVQLELITAEMQELPKKLRRGEVDLVFLDHPLQKAGMKSHLIGHEENVLIESSSHKGRDQVYLDHDQEDDTTRNFLESLKKNSAMAKLAGSGHSRSFLDEIYGIIDGVAEGLGRAVVPLHLVRHEKRVRPVKGGPSLSALRVPVYLNYPDRPYYSKLQEKIIQQLLERAPSYLP